MRKAIAVLTMMLFTEIAWAGAWGTGAFENDAALDWLSACVQAQGNSAVSSALNAVFDGEFVDADIGAAAIAAAEAVAAQRGRPGPHLPTDLRRCLEHQLKSANLAASAAKVVEKVRNPKTSELAAEWAKNNLKEWHASLDDLAKRLAH